MKWPWPPLRLADALGFAFVLAILCMFIVLTVGFPNVFQRATNAGFGPGWDCTPMPKGDPVCIKKIGAAK
jgi:hypothetical protein